MVAPGQPGKRRTQAHHQRRGPMKHERSGAGAGWARRWLVLALVVCALPLGLAACGDDDDSSSDGGNFSAQKEQGTAAPATKAASGEPIKVMTITSLDSQGPVYPNIAI